MPLYTLTYARVVILKTTLWAPDEFAAKDLAFELELTQELGLEDFKAKKGSEVDDIQDCYTIWEIEYQDPGDPDEADFAYETEDSPGGICSSCGMSKENINLCFVCQNILCDGCAIYWHPDQGYACEQHATPEMKARLNE